MEELTNKALIPANQRVRGYCILSGYGATPAVSKVKFHVWENSTVDGYCLQYQ